VERSSAEPQLKLSGPLEQPSVFVTDLSESATAPSAGHWE
jgi:hypothetical protein